MKKAKRIFGFSLYFKSGNWQAAKRLRGKLKWVYIGKDLDKAEEKIKAWSLKHGIPIKIEPEFIRQTSGNDLEKRVSQIENSLQGIQYKVDKLEKENEKIKKLNEDLIKLLSKYMTL